MDAITSGLAVAVGLVLAVVLLYVAAMAYYLIRFIAQAKLVQTFYYLFREGLLYRKLTKKGIVYTLDGDTVKVYGTTEDITKHKALLAKAIDLACKGDQLHKNANKELDKIQKQYG